MNGWTNVVIGTVVIALTATAAWAIYPKLSATLVGVQTNGVTPRGDARIDQSKYPMELPRLEVRGDDINLPDGSVLTVHMHNAQIGTLRVSGKRVQGAMNTIYQVGANEDLFIRHNGVDVLFYTARWKN
ncbi:MAG TPA: hypothetical protein VFF69_07810 [Phycisphaerales bacterium]|nr:hypothetical protein [Phycisphaerales bacterium]